MSNVFAQWGMLLPLSGLISVGASGHLWADSLTVEPLQNTYYLFEPIAVRVTLQLDEPYVRAPNDPVEASRQWRRIKRRLILELRKDDMLLCTALLTGNPFVATASPSTEFHDTLLGCLGVKTCTSPEYQFAFWDEPGAYVLIVRDPESGLQSNETNITIVKPEAAEAVPATLFASGGLSSLLLLIDKQHGEEAIPTFERIVKDYPQSIYGKYAKTCLLLRRLERLSPTNTAPPARDLWPALVAELKDAATFFDAGHPLRSYALLHLARLQRALGANSKSEDTIRILLAESRDGYFVREANGLLRARSPIGRRMPDTEHD